MIHVYACTYTCTLYVILENCMFICTHVCNICMYMYMNSNMYWTDLDQDLPRVERARMDGTERMVLPGVTGAIKQPSNIAVDPLTRLVYWSDTFPDNEKIVKYDGERDSELGIPRMLFSLKYSKIHGTCTCNYIMLPAICVHVYQSYVGNFEDVQ